MSFQCIKAIEASHAATLPRYLNLVIRIFGREPRARQVLTRTLEADGPSRGSFASPSRRSIVLDRGRSHPRAFSPFVFATIDQELLEVQ